MLYVCHPRKGLCCPSGKELGPDFEFDLPSFVFKHRETWMNFDELGFRNGLPHLQSVNTHPRITEQ